MSRVDKVLTFGMLIESAEELVKSFEEDEVEVLWSGFYVKSYDK